MEIAVAGLGRMGAGMARRLARGGHQVVAWNRHAEVAHDLAVEPENGGRVIVADPIEQLGSAMPGPRSVIISVASGDATEHMIQQLIGILEPRDLIVDSGNSHFRDSKRRDAMGEGRGIDWL